MSEDFDTAYLDVERCAAFGAAVRLRYIASTNMSPVYVGEAYTPS
jgi:hypothetical protein